MNEIETPKYVQLQVTYPTRADAESAASTLVGKRLAACAQILGEIESRYVWRGKLENERETLLLAKTKTTLFERVAAEIESTHPYECPQVVAAPLVCVSPKYAAWLDEQIDDEQIDVE